MKVLLIVAALVAVSNAASVSREELEFQSWKQKHGRSYSSEEEESQRKIAWMTNRKLVLEHNMLADQGLKTYRLGMNHFADMDNQEYQIKFASCLKSFNRTKIQHVASFHRQAESDPPQAINWIEKGYVTAVKNQFTCQSCWAFSATGALEALSFKKTEKLVSLSEQQLVDCSGNYRNNGCRGGYPWKAFEYVRDNGLELEMSYPYNNKEGNCRVDPNKNIPTWINIKTLPSGNETCLQLAVGSHGPVSVCIDTRRYTFQLYESGVYEDPFCSNSEADHAVLVVGYGTLNGQEYWLVKNSWGVNWGDDGYIKIAKNKNNMCAIASYASYPDTEP